MKTIKIGLIGYGRIAPKHIEGYLSEGGVRIAAICGPRPENAYALAEKYGIRDAEIFSDYREMLARHGIVDAVDIMTPDYLHAEISNECAAAGLHVLCEKPLALNTPQAIQMYDAIKNSGVIGMPGFVYRFNPAVLTVKKLIEEGVIGDIFHFRARITVSRLSNPNIPIEWRQERSKGGYGALSDLGSHLIDLARFLLNDEFAIVSGLGQVFIKHRRRGETEELAQVTAYEAALFGGEMSKGTMVQIEVSRFAAGSNAFELDGSLGSIRFTNGVLYRWDKEIVDHQKPLSEFQIVDVNEEHFKPYEIDNYRNFIHCIREGAPPSPNFHDGIICQKVLDAVDESIRTGGIVYINDLC